MMTQRLISLLFLLLCVANQAFVQPHSGRKRSLHGNTVAFRNNGASLLVERRAAKGKQEAEEEKSTTTTPMENFTNNPGNLIAAPFIFLLGLDLVLNILVLTKRTIEVIFTGHYTVWNIFGEAASSSSSM